MIKEAYNVDPVSSTVKGEKGRITLYLDDENGETVAFNLRLGQAKWLRSALKHAIELREEK